VSGTTLTYIFLVLGGIMMVLTAAHAVMFKRDGRTALGWLAFIGLAPVIGAMAYIGFGINRVRRQSRVKEIGARIQHPPTSRWPDAPIHLGPLQRLTENLSRFPLVAGHNVDILEEGEQAYPAMLDAIAGAKASIALSTYIFDNDRTGKVFVGALKAAVDRGVEVRVLVDAVGLRYSRPPLTRTLKKAGIPYARFMPPVLPWAINLRNHRKILTIDGVVAFTGGMNIRHGHLVEDDPKRPVRDVHFRLTGPIVTQLQHIFAEDWAFARREHLGGELWFPTIVEPDGGLDRMSRAIAGGPDEDFQTIHLAMTGALTTAEHRAIIVTPYFLPDPSLITALNVAALRGVQVDILLPRNNNNYLVKWASQATLWQVLERGCRVWYSSGPFDHAKLFVVDDVWTMLGTANWDPRSLRLNFELMVEAYDPDLAARVTALCDARIATAARVTLEQVDKRSVPVRLRDAIARLMVGFL